MFLFTDAHVADEGFLELINNMLTSGMVPALYDDSEKDGLVNRCRGRGCGEAVPTLPVIYTCTGTRLIEGL